MTEKEIKRIVKMTINEFRRERLLNDARTEIEETSDRLFRFYNGTEDKEMEAAIDAVRRDKYFCIITLYYRENMTIEKIAEKIDVDVRTVTRNKRRLCLEICTKLL